MSESNTAKIRTILIQLGAEDSQAEVMARQLLKRADQMARERNTTPAEALAYLLQVTIAGREGRVLDQPPPGNSHNQAG